MRGGRSLLIWLLIIALAAAIAEGVREWRMMRGTPLVGHARVVDGDSLEIAGQRIRLFGIDAPELHQDCRTADGNVYDCGAAARRALAELVGGHAITCMPVGTSHDRAVARCQANGRDLGEALVRAGHALELQRFSRGRYYAAEREARAARRGLWAGSFEEPAVWRREQGR
jgi:endonuclease YncB( thermonuclease family)